MTITFAQESLNKAKENLSGTSSSESSSSSSSDNNQALNDGTGFFEGIIIEIFIQATYGVLIGGLQPRSFYRYPYAEGEHGEYKLIENEAKGNQSKFMISNTVVVQSDLYGNDLKFNYRFLPIIGVEVNHLHFFENDDENTQLGVSSLMLNYYRIRENNVSGYWGIGATYAGSGVNTSGFSYNLGMDIYVANPISVGLFWKQTFMNNSSMNEFRALARYHIKRTSIQGGFIHYKLGGVNFPSAAIGIEFRL